jgi:hypothetical protein
MVRASLAGKGHGKDNTRGCFGQQINITVGAALKKVFGHFCRYCHIEHPADIESMPFQITFWNIELTRPAEFEASLGVFEAKHFASLFPQSLT